MPPVGEPPQDEPLAQRQAEAVAPQLRPRRGEIERQLPAPRWADLANDPWMAAANWLACRVSGMAG